MTSLFFCFCFTENNAKQDANGDIYFSIQRGISSHPKIPNRSWSTTWRCLPWWTSHSPAAARNAQCSAKVTVCGLNNHFGPSVLPRNSRLIWSRKWIGKKNSFHLDAVGRPFLPRISLVDGAHVKQHPFSNKASIENGLRIFAVHLAGVFAGEWRGFAADDCEKLGKLYMVRWYLIIQQEPSVACWTLQRQNIPTLSP